MRICLLGSFSGRNIGDDAILKGILYILEETFNDYELVLLSKFPKYFTGFPSRLILKRSRVGLISLNTFLELFHSDIFFIPQSNLFSQKILNSFYNRMFAYLAIIWINKCFFKKPIGLFFGGIGPLHSLVGEQAAKWIVRNLDFIVLRENQSIKYLQKWEINTQYILAADTALFCKMESTQLTEKIRKQIQGKRAVGINLNKYFSEFSNTGISKSKHFNQMGSFLRSQKDSIFIFLPSDTEDIAVTREFMTSARLWESSCLVEKCKPEEYIQIQSLCDFFIGTRLHSLIMCAVANTAFIGINYHPKVRDFMQQLDCEEYCLDLADVDFRKLTEKFDSLVASQTSMREKISTNVFGMRTAILDAAESSIEKPQVIPWKRNRRMSVRVTNHPDKNGRFLQD